MQLPVTGAYEVFGNMYVLVKVPAGVLSGNYWARGKFEKVM